MLFDKYFPFLSTSFNNSLNSDVKKNQILHFEWLREAEIILVRTIIEKK